jgi:hypothetical protein
MLCGLELRRQPNGQARKASLTLAATLSVHHGYSLVFGQYLVCKAHASHLTISTATRI